MHSKLPLVRNTERAGKNVEAGGTVGKREHAHGSARPPTKAAARGSLHRNGMCAGCNCQKHKTLIWDLGLRGERPSDTASAGGDQILAFFCSKIQKLRPIASAHKI